MVPARIAILFGIIIIAAISLVLFTACEEDDENIIEPGNTFTPTPEATETPQETGTPDPNATATPTPSDWGDKTPTPTPPAGLTGRWEGLVYGTGASEDPTIVLDLEQMGAQVTGTINTSDGYFLDAPLEIGTFVDDELVFNATSVTGVRFEFQALLINEDLQGQWTRLDNAQGGSWFAHRM